MLYLQIRVVITLNLITHVSLNKINSEIKAQRIKFEVELLLRLSHLAVDEEYYLNPSGLQCTPSRSSDDFGGNTVLRDHQCQV